MYLNPRLVELLESYDAERLQALLLWFNAEQQSLGSQSHKLSAILEEAQGLDADACYQAAEKLNLQDMVDVSILNEFGPDIRRKSFFNTLSQAVCRRFQG